MADQIAQGITAFLEAHKGVSLSDWVSNTIRSTGRARASDLSIFQSAHFAQTVKTVYVGDVECAFSSFPRIEGNALAGDNGFAEKLFPGDSKWLTDYIKSGTRPTDPAKLAFVRAYDDIMVAHATIQPHTPHLNVTHFLTPMRDSIYTDAELAQILNVKLAPSLPDYPRAQTIAERYGGALNDDYAAKFVLFTGAILNGQDDIDDVDRGSAIRGTAAEMRDVLSPMAKARVKASNETNFILKPAFDSGQDPLAVVASAMNSMCGQEPPEKACRAR